MPIGVLPTGANAESLASGRTTVDFGAFPGSTLVTANIADAGIVADSVVSVWLEATQSADHSSDEAIVDGPSLVVGDITPGVGFVLYADASKVPGSTLYGVYNVAWLRR